MRFFWKLLLVAVPAIGGYWLYKESKRLSEIDTEPEPAEENKADIQSSSGQTAEKQDGTASTDQILKQLAEIDGVTSRVAENLVEKGIQSKEELTKLSREELMEIKGIGPKRAEKILNMK